MREWLRNPNFYYIAVPVVAAFWAMYARAVMLPEAEQEKQKTRQSYQQTQVVISDILNIAPERLELSEQKQKNAEFDYSTVIEQYARLWNIPSSAYSLHAYPTVRRGKTRTKKAVIKVNDVSVETFAQFYSTMMFEYPDLQCERVKLNRTKASKDSWDISMELNYVY